MDLLAGLGADHSMSAFAPANPKTDGLKSAKPGGRCGQHIKEIRPVAIQGI